MNDLSLQLMKLLHFQLIPFVILSLFGVKKIYAQHPVANFETSLQSGCVPLTISFNNTSENATTYFWDFGNGTTSTLENPSITYIDPNNYTVTLISENTNGQKDTLTITNAIEALDAPQTNFSFTASASCANDNLISFTNLTLPSSNYLWDFGDGHVSYDENPTHHYSNEGTYTVTLMASNHLGCSSIKQIPQAINITPNPQPAFITNATQTCDPDQPFVFTNQSSNANQWLWDFGDGNVSSTANPNHVYHQIGRYNIRLIALNNAGCADTLFLENHIAIDSLPSINFTADVQTGCIPLDVTFSNQSSSSHHVSWNFGNGTSSTSNTITYHDTGTFDVQVTIENEHGCIDSLTITDYINVTPGVTASFTVNNNSTCINNSIQFTNTSSNAISYLWDFGNGDTSTAVSPSYTYQHNGNYTVMLTAFHPNGCEQSTSATIKVVDVEADFDVDKISGCAPLTVNFSNKSVNATEWIWDFGNGSSSSSQNPSHTFVIDTSFGISLIAKNAVGCADTIFYDNLITVSATQMELRSDTIHGCLPLSADLSNNDIGTGSWLWNFGDGDTSSLRGPVHMYRNPGTYNISLTTQTAEGCHLSIPNYTTFVIEHVEPEFSIVQMDCNNLIAQFADSSLHAAAWLWDFGDGTFSTDQHPIHTFPSHGVFDVSLTLTSPHGCSASIIYPNYLDFLSCGTNSSNSSDPPQGSMLGMGSSTDSNNVVQRNTNCAPSNIQFYNSDTTAFYWEWNFGDGIVSHEEHPSHTYLQPGLYNVTLIKENVAGRDTTTWQNMVEVNGPTANFTPNLYPTCDSVKVVFTDHSPLAQEWKWNFGDGNTSTEKSPEHYYLRNNSLYPTSLTVTDSSKCQSTSITVINTFNYAISFLYQDTICVNSPIHFLPSDTLEYTYSYDFGDGTHSSSSTPLHKYNNAGFYTVNITCTHIASGCIEFHKLDSIYVKGVMAEIGLPDSTLACPETNIYFEPTQTHGGLYRWNINNQWITGTTAPTHQFDDPGVYDITLEITTDGCVDQITYPSLITISDVEAGFNIIQTSLCKPFEIELTNQSNNAVNWSWNIDQNIVTNDTNMKHQFTATSTEITLGISDAIGCTDTLTKTFSPHLINASFTPSNTIGCAPFEVDFNSSSQQVVASYWDFGDGTTSTETNPSHTYTSAGIYNVTQIVEGPGGCLDTLYKSNLIEAFAVDANYTVDTNVTCVPTVLNFKGVGQDVTSWYWDFGDNSFSNLQNPTHIYNTAGTYEITLAVSDVNGCSDTIKTENGVIIPGSITYFSITDSITCDNAITQFRDLSTNASSWYWTFGDGNTSTAKNPTHLYEAPGTYTVSLVTEDSTGCSNSYISSTPFTLVSAPKAKFSVNKRKGCAPFELNINDLTSNATSWKWDMGDGNGLGTTPSTYSYATAGNYTITLTAKNDQGCEDIFTVDNIIVMQPEDATITDPGSFCENQNVITLSSLNPGGTWSGEGIVDSNLGIFSPTDAGAGDHVISYHIPGTCSDHQNITIPVLKAPKALPQVAQNKGCHELTTTFSDSSNMDAQMVYNWTIGNDIYENNMNPSITFLPGSYDVELVVIASNTCSDTAFIPSYIEVYDTVPHSYSIDRVSVVSDTSIIIEWPMANFFGFDYYSLYRFNVLTNNYEQITTISDITTTSYIDTGINTMKDVYCYKISVTNKCDETSDMEQCNSHCAMNMTTQTVGKHHTKVDWTPYIGCNVDNYVVYRNKIGNDNLQPIASVTSTSFSYTDTTSYCSGTYNYKVEAVKLCETSLNSWSNIGKITQAGIDSIQISDIVRGTVVDNKSVLIEWTIPIIAPSFVEGYRIYRSEGEQYEVITTLPKGINIYHDLDVEVMQKKYSYKIEVLNGCAKEKIFGEKGSSIHLQSEKIGEEEYILEWTPYQNWEDGVDYYEIQKLNDQNQWEVMEQVPGILTNTKIRY